MELGAALWTMQSTAASPTNLTAAYRDLVDDARLVEELGFVSLWLAEHRVWYDAWCPAPLVAAAAAAAATERLRFGTAMLLLTQRDALRLAETAATLDRLSGGRLDLGVGLGHRDPEFDALGVSRRERGARMTEALDVLLRAWGAEPFAFQGEHFSYDQAAVEPKPVQRPHPPIWIGGMADAAIRRGARRGLSFLLPQTLYPHEISQIVARISEEAAAAGVERGRIGMLRDGWVEADGNRARDRIVPLLASHYREEAGAWWVFKGAAHGFARPDLLDRQLNRIVETALVGTPDEVIAGLAEAAAVGVDFVAVRMNFDVTRGNVRDCLALFARDVIPAAAELTVSS